MNKQQEIINSIRKFNRFYLAKLNLLNDKYLASGFSLIEARILFELLNKTQNAIFLATKLNIDKGYLSRIIKKLENNSLIERKISKNDGRFLDIALTAEGIKVTQQLIEHTNLKMGKIISNFSDVELDIINESMNKIMAIFDKEENK